MVNLAEWAKEYESKRKGERAGEKEFKKQLCITLKKEGLTSHGMLHVNTLISLLLSKES